MWRGFAPALLALCLLCGCGGDDHPLRCVAQQGTATSFSGLGVCYTANVVVTLKDAAGDAVSPSYRALDTTPTGTDFWTNVYLQDRLHPGYYTVEVRHCEDRHCVVQRYSLRLRRDVSPLLTVVCR